MAVVMNGNSIESFNEKCDKVLIYLKEIATANDSVQELIKPGRLAYDTGISINDPVINFLSHKKNFIDIDIKNEYVQISSLGIIQSC